MSPVHSEPPTAQLRYGRTTGTISRFYNNYDVRAQAVPLRTNAEMVRILRIYNGSNDIEGMYGRKLIRNRYEQEYVEVPPGVNPRDRNRIKKTGRANPPPPHGLKIVRGITKTY